MKRKAIIAMSGGVDSSVAAFLMKQQGCDCIGATMKLFRNEDIGLSREHTCFPLGSLTKSQVRRIAEEQGFANARKHDSQDICFVQNGSYADFIQQYTGKAYPQGNFVDTSGRVLGQHRGTIHYTIGQRRGLHISSDAPLYVCGIDSENNLIVLGREQDLYVQSIIVRGINLIPISRMDAPMRLTVKLRSCQKEQWATVRQTAGDTLEICFDSPQRAPAKGQAAVLYDGDTIVGGGTIQ